MVKPLYNLPAPDEDDLAAARHWLGALPPDYSPADRERLSAACDLLTRCSERRTLETGEGRVRHLLCTADILVRLQMDADTLIAALLNGCLGHAEVDEAAVAARFGPGIARMVADLGRIAQIADVDAVIAAKDLPEHEENLRRLLLGIAEDVRVVLVVLAERLHLMRSIKGLDSLRRDKIARDTRRIYAPLANRLGVWQIKWELEDLSLRYLEPAEYERIASLLDGRREERERYIAGTIAVLKEKLSEAEIAAEVTGRPKHIDSIWRKMKRKGVDFDQIYDVRAIRVLVADVASCYAALGVVHATWRYIPKELDDYIAAPKGNMYQSLHTAVIGPEDKPLEVQIRTFDMHRHAELGVAAHWAYKERKRQDDQLQRRVSWMRQWLELRDDGDEANELIARLKAELAPSHIYVLTPKAQVVELPQGATPLDFAYAIHSDIGHRCRGARVNGRIVPLNRELSSGETVEILTHKQPSPSRDWLSPHQGYLKTAKARNRVRQWFKQLDYDRYLAEGRTILERELGRLGQDTRAQLDPLALRYNLHKGDDLLAAIGRGELSPGQIARQLGEPREAPPPPARRPPVTRTPTKPGGKPVARTGVLIEGVDDLMLHIAHCCKPVPDDPIVGYVTRGRGVTIHREDCVNMRTLPEAERERLVAVRWAEQEGQAAYLVDIVVVASDRKGLLRDISSVLADEDINVIGSSSLSDRHQERASMRFTVEITNAARLAPVMAKIAQIPDVLEVRRPH